MEALTGSPFTLVVKAPNQEIGDQTIECFMDWTVRKLKEHLSTVYPNNPNERSQRIIYSGKLLPDNLILKDVLTVNDVQDKCTVHLVCTPSAEEQAKRDASSRLSSGSNQARPSRSPVLTSSDGVRQRTAQSQATAPSPQQQPQQQNPTIFPHATFPNATSLPSSPGAIPVPPGMMPSVAMTTQQQWMQHMYAQQMAAYMQYASVMAAGGGMQPGWNQGYQMPSPWIQPTPHPAASVNQPHAAAPQQPAPQPEENPLPQAAAPANNNNNPQRMNVGGGQPADDGNEDGVRRDWLDWTFMLCRFGILLSIVYFYSSVNRFLLVGGAMFLMYLYQAGYFQLRRRQRNRPPVTPPPQEPAPGREEMPQDGASEGNDGQADESDTSTGSSDDTDGAEGTEVTEPEEPPRPGLLVTMWVFISTFFTSIIPQGPAQQFPAN